METVLSRIEKEFILRTAVYRQLPAVLIRKSVKINAYFTDIRADELSISISDNGTGELTAGQTLILSLRFKNFIFTGRTRLLSRVDGNLVLRQPETLHRRPVPSQKRLPEETAGAGLFAFGRKLSLRFPGDNEWSVSSDGSAPDAGNAAERFNAAMISELLRSYRLWASGRSFESKVILFGKRDPATPYERLVRETGKTLILSPSSPVVNNFPFHLPAFEILEKKEISDTEGKSTDQFELFCPVVMGTMIPAYLYLSAGKKNRNELRTDEISMICRFSRIFSHALFVNGYPGGFSEEKNPCREVEEAVFIDACSEGDSLRLTFAVENSVCLKSDSCVHAGISFVSGGEKIQCELDFTREISDAKCSYYSGTVSGPVAGELVLELQTELIRYRCRDVSSGIF